MTLQVPSAAAVAVRVCPPITTLTVAPGSAVPLRVGVVSLVMLSLVEPLLLPMSKPTVVAGDTVVSMVIGLPVVVEVLPAGSVTVTTGA